MTGDQLRTIGKLLFGSFAWRAQFEDYFGISPRSLQRMLTGAEPIPDGLAHDCEVALRDHGTKLDEILEIFV